MTCSRLLPLLRGLFLSCLVLIFSANVLKAEETKGTFYLPFETEWAGVPLPAGEYSFTIDSMGQKTIVLRSAEGKTFYRLIANAEKLNTEASSQLLIVHGAKKSMVHILYLAEFRTAYHFSVPQQYEVTSRIIAAASEPARVEHIPVVASGN